MNIPKLRFPEFDGEWEKKKLGEIVEFRNGKAHEQDISEDGKYIVVNSKFISMAGEVKKYSDTQICPLEVGEIVMVMSDVPNGKALAKCFYVDENNRYTLNQRICALKATAVEPKFLLYILNRNRYYLMFDSGVGQTNLTRDEVLNCPLEIPMEKKEQTKIANFLSAIDDKINLLSRKKEQLELYKKAVMQKLFNQEIRFKDDDGKEFPKWERKKLGEVGEFCGGGTPDTNKEEYWNGEIQWFTPSEIKYDHVSNSLRTISELGLRKSSAKILPKGTLLITTRATIGEVAIALNECTTNQGFQSLLVKEEFNNIFVFNWVKFNKQEFILRANGSTFTEISKFECEKISIAIPTLPEQQKIANFLSAIDDKVNLTTKAIDTTKQWKKGLLQKMFV